MAACIIMEAVSGSSYAFSVYSPGLKASWGYTQQQIETAGSIGNIGLYMAIVAGLWFDANGPKSTAIISAILSAVGYVLLYLAAAGNISHSLGLVALYCWLWSHGSSWADTCAISVNVKNFPNDKGTVLGVMKALFGLSASVVTLFYSQIFKPNVNEFLLFLACLIPATVGVCSLALNLVPSGTTAMVRLSKGEHRHINIAYCGVILLALYLSTVGVLQNSGKVGSSPWFAYALLPVILITAGVLAVPASDTNSKAPSTIKNAKLVDEDDDDDKRQLLVNVNDINGDGILINSNNNNTGGGNEEGTEVAVKAPGAPLIEAALSLDFLLFCVILFCGSGAGLTLINNVGTLTKALGAPDNGQDVYIVLLSVFNCLGRAVFGFLSDAFSHVLTRPGWFTVTVSCMAAAQVVLTFSGWCLFIRACMPGFMHVRARVCTTHRRHHRFSSSHRRCAHALQLPSPVTDFNHVADLNLLYLGTMMTGFAYGGFWSLGPPLIADRFGMKAFAATYSLTSLWTAGASYLLSATMASMIYQSHIPSSAPDQVDCLAGAACYRDTFVILACLCGACGLMGIWLTRRMRPVYDDTGKAIPYTEFSKTAAGKRSVLARAAQRGCLPLCCCAYGRSLLVDEDDDDVDVDGDISTPDSIAAVSQLD